MNIFHRYAYFFSLVFYILPVSLIFDGALKFKVLKKLTTLKGLFYVTATIGLMSFFDYFWLQTSYFPKERILLSIFGIPIEEILAFILAFYNITAILAWSNKHFS